MGSKVGTLCEAGYRGSHPAPKLPLSIPASGCIRFSVRARQTLPSSNLGSSTPTISNKNPALGHMLIPEAIREIREMGYGDQAINSFLGLGIGYGFSLTSTGQAEEEGSIVLKTNTRRDA